MYKNVTKVSYIFSPTKNIFMSFLAYPTSNHIYIYMYFLLDLDINTISRYQNSLHIIISINIIEGEKRLKISLKNNFSFRFGRNLEDFLGIA